MAQTKRQRKTRVSKTRLPRKPLAVNNHHAEEQKRVLKFTRAEDTKRYAKFIVSERDGVFGHIYVPLDKATGLVAFEGVGVRG